MVRAVLFGSGGATQIAGEFFDVVVAEHLDLVGVVAGEAAELVEGGEALGVVDGAGGGHRGDGVGGVGHLAAEVVGVADVQGPAVAVADGNAAVAGGVTEEGDEEDLRVEAEVEAAGFEAEPGFARGGVGDPAGIGR